MVVRIHSCNEAEDCWGKAVLAALVSPRKMYAIFSLPQADVGRGEEQIQSYKSSLHHLLAISS
jgi:hypothetical protein